MKCKHCYKGYKDCPYYHNDNCDKLPVTFWQIPKSEKKGKK